MALGKWIESCRAHMLRHPADAAKKPKLVGNSDNTDIALSAAPPWTLPHTTLGLVNNALLKRSAAAKLYASTRYPNTFNRGTNPPAALEFELATSCQVAWVGRPVARFALPSGRSLFAAERFNASNRGTNPPVTLEFKLATSHHVAWADRFPAAQSLASPARLGARSASRSLRLPAGALAFRR